MNGYWTTHEYCSLRSSQLADWTSCGLDSLRTSDAADWAAGWLVKSQTGWLTGDTISRKWHYVLLFSSSSALPTSCTQGRGANI